MQRGFRVGRIFGINIYIDWSWLFVFLLISWNLSSAFGHYHADWRPMLRWSTAIGAALLFFGSLLAHELAHSLLAQARGVPVRSITLHLFGGVSNIERDPDSPSAEFLVAVMGPITSLVIGVALLALVSARSGGIGDAVSDPEQVLAQLSPLSTLLAWLGSINVVLGLFNLIPGFPLDGGRILRSILWALTNSLKRATRWAAGVGHIVAWSMIISGIAMAFGARIPFFGTGLINGLWLAFVGWFLNGAASQSYRQVIVRDILEDVPVSRVMRNNPPIVSGECTVSSLVHDHVMRTDDHAFPVMKEGQLIGLTTLEDIRSVDRHSWDGTLVREIMTPAERLVTVSPDDNTADALQTLVRRDVRQLPVMKNGGLVGLVRRRDIVKWLQLQSEMS